MGGYLTGAVLLVAQIVIGLVLLILVLRIILPLTRVRFDNPVCQMVYRLTNPIMRPLAPVLPNWRRFTIAGLVIAYLAATLLGWLFMLIAGARPGIAYILVAGVGTLIFFTLSLYFFTILIVAVMSFFQPRPGPAVDILRGITEPVLRPFRRLPPRGLPIDLSTLYAIVVILLIRYTLVYIGMPGIPFF
jgi:YggT family protein